MAKVVARWVLWHEPTFRVEVADGPEELAAAWKLAFGDSIPFDVATCDGLRASGKAGQEAIRREHEARLVSMRGEHNTATTDAEALLLATLARFEGEGDKARAAFIAEVERAGLIRAFDGVGSMTQARDEEMGRWAVRLKRLSGPGGYNPIAAARAFIEELERALIDSVWDCYACDPMKSAGIAAKRMAASKMVRELVAFSELAKSRDAARRRLKLPAIDYKDDPATSVRSIL